MRKIVELPIMPPVYGTYHYQGTSSAIFCNNPSVRNWYLSEALSLKCTRKFLDGYTSPEIGVVNASWSDNPHLVKYWYSMRFLKGHTHTLIRNLLDEGFYVYYCGIDDYYIKGKTWYHERHRRHDGTICGYDQENKTYCVYAYDENWRYQKFWISQKDFEKGRKALFQKKDYGYICGLRAKPEPIPFIPKLALLYIREYLHSNLKKYPFSGSGEVRGIVVHDYIEVYLGKLYDSSIPYERMDRRVFRLIWEQKCVMRECLQCIERELELGTESSQEYEAVVMEAERMRMLYASHHMRRRDSVLPLIQNLLRSVKEKEEKILGEVLEKTGGEKVCNCGNT